ncbi:MAG: sugar ABC transporter permease [Lachnospiraceae bacterium]|nr:sugar ABC transporter permease [Lachnospiraceae bacterium]
MSAENNKKKTTDQEQQAKQEKELAKRQKQLAKQEQRVLRAEGKEVNKKGKTKRSLTLHQRHSLQGLVFVAPFIIGMCMFFIYPICMSLRLSVASSLKVVGMKLSGFTIEYYVRAFVIDTEFLPTFGESIAQTLIKFPLIIALSLIIAILLNRDIKCRGMFRTIFFIPFLLGTGDVYEQLINQGVDRAVLNIMDGELIPYNVLAYFGDTIMTAVQTVLGLLVTVLWGSGVQILLFLSGLQSISSSLYEAAKIDGATEWEMFWKITIPMISPIMLLNIVYTIVDSFTNIQNPLLEYIQTYGFDNAQFQYGAALGWIYFAFIGVLVALVFAIMRNYIHTNEVEEVKKHEKRGRKVFTIEKSSKRSYE